MRLNMSVGRMYVCLVAACVVAGSSRFADAQFLFSIDVNGDQLVEVDSVTGFVNSIGPLGQAVTHTDLAIANGRLYAVDTTTSPPGPVHVLEIDRANGAATTPILVTCPMCAAPVDHAEGLAQAGGNLYVAFNFRPDPPVNRSASHAVGLLNPGTGMISMFTDFEPLSPGADFDGLTEFPCGLTAFPTGHLLAVDHNPGPEEHTYFDLSGTIAVIGLFPDVPTNIGVNDLVFCGGILYGLDHGRRLITTHDPTSGQIIGTSSAPYSAQLSLTGLACVEETCVPPLASMCAWWPLDDDPGPKALELVGANDGNHINVPTPLPGEVVDTSLCFNGTSQYVEVLNGPQALDLGAAYGDNFTIDAWVRADDVTGVRPIVDKRNAVPEGYELFVYNGSLGFQMADGIGSNCNCGTPNSVCTNYVAPTADITAGVWHHVTVTVFYGITWGGNLYVDGNLVHSFNPRGGPMANGADLWIGRNHANPCAATAYWEGCIDEVEFFNEALSIDDIRAIRDSCRGGKCKPHCCLPPGPVFPNWRCVTMLEPDCLNSNGFPVDDCLGDLDSNGIDDACECHLVDAAPSYCEGVCPGPLPPPEVCVPRCVNYNPQTGLAEAIDCDCVGCYVEISTSGLPPDCNTNTCDPGTLCVRSEVVLTGGTIDICCDCVPGPPIPAVSKRGLAVMGLFILLSGALALRHRAKAVSKPS